MLMEFFTTSTTRKRPWDGIQLQLVVWWSASLPGSLEAEAWLMKKTYVANANDFPCYDEYSAHRAIYAKRAPAVAGRSQLEGAQTSMDQVEGATAYQVGHKSRLEDLT